MKKPCARPKDPALPKTDCPARPGTHHGTQELTPRRARPRGKREIFRTGCRKSGNAATASARRVRRRGARGPQARHIGFAVNMPSAGPGALCPRRRGTGIGHKVPRQARLRTPGRGENARIFCVAAPPLAHNARTAALGQEGGRRIPATLPKMITVLEACRGIRVLARQRPPRKPPPWAAPGPPHLGSAAHDPGRAGKEITRPKSRPAPSCSPNSPLGEPQEPDGEGRLINWHWSALP